MGGGNWRIILNWILGVYVVRKEVNVRVYCHTLILEVLNIGCATEVR